MIFPQFFLRYPGLSRSLIGLLVLLLAFSFILSINNGYAKQSVIAAAATQLQTHDFTPISQSHSSPDYLNVVEQSLIAAEGIKLSVYNDGQNIPTIGIGY